MNDFNFENLPILKVFKELQVGDKVYSKQYGLGEILSLYREDEVIIRFSNLTKRLSIHDGISIIPAEYLRKLPSRKLEVIWEGKHIRFADLKRKNRDEKARIKLEKEILQESRRRARNNKVPSLL